MIARCFDLPKGQNKSVDKPFIQNKSVEKDKNMSVLKSKSPQKDKPLQNSLTKKPIVLEKRIISNGKTNYKPTFLQSNTKKILIKLNSINMNRVGKGANDSKNYVIIELT